MEQNETGLKPAQVAVLRQLVAGESVTDAAKAADVSRSTVYRWLSEDYDFKAELNRYRRELQEATAAALLSIALQATKNVSAAIEGGDVVASLKVLKGIGALSGQAPEIGSADAEVLKEDDELARASAQNDRILRAMLTLGS